MYGRIVGIAVVGLLASAPALPAQLLTVGQDPQVSPQRTALCAAVLGHVERPAAYRLERGQLTELIAAAGGLTEIASRNVRIIRTGRGSQKVYLAPGADFPLRAGDVVIVEGNRHMAGAARQVRTGTGTIIAGRLSSDTVGRAAKPLRVSVAVLGAQPWPVVLTLPSHQASLPALYRGLNQSARGRVVVVNAAGVPQAIDAATSNEPLSPDSVVILDARSIDRSLLPRLPEPAAVGGATAPFREPDVSAPVIGPEIGAAIPGRLPRSDGIVELQPSSPDTPGLSGPPGLRSPKAAESTPAPASDATTESTASARPALPAFGALENAAEAKLPETPVPAPREVPQTRVDAPGAKAATSWANLPAPLVFVGASGLFLIVLTALTWASRGHKPVTPAVHSVEAASVAAALAAPVLHGDVHDVSVPGPQSVTTESAVPPKPAAGTLELLIRNQLPLVEEPPAIAEAVRLIGRPVARTQRYDEADALPDPHFDSSAAQQDAGQVPDSHAARQKAIRIDRPHPEKGLLDRALSAVNKDAVPDGR